MSEITRSEIEAFLYYEARLLDDRKFEEWLECYREDAEFWMPAWDDNGELTEDPQSEISLIYSSATSLPEPRTGHNTTNVEILERRDGEVDIRFNWITFYYRYNTTDTYFGTTFITLDVSGETPKIVKKKVVLKNDYIHHIVDIYHV